MTRQAYSLAFSVVVFVVFASAVWVASEFTFTAGYFPLFVSASGAALSFVNVCVEVSRMVRRAVKVPVGGEELRTSDDDSDQNVRVEARDLLWVGFFLVIIIVIGFIAGMGVFLLSFLAMKTNFGWIKVLVSTAVAIGAVLLLADVLSLSWPSGLFDVVPIFG